jgi:type IV pilus assembly protein PilC
MYSYKAVDAQGTRIKGLQDAANPIDLEQHLKHSGLDLISAKQQTSSSGRSNIKRIDLITFFFNIDQLHRAGVPLLECLTDMHDSMDDTTFRKIIADLMKSIESGRQLSQAMARHPNTFDPVILSLIRAGEESGKLAEAFGHLCASLKWQDEIASKFKNMMLYPAFVAATVLAVTSFLMIYLVPQLVGFIKGMGHEIPMQTRLLLFSSSVFVHYWYAIFAAPFGVLLAYKSALALNPELRYHIDNLKLHIWPTGEILRKIIMARFAHAFAMMYSSGISVLDCITHTRGLANNLVIAQSLHAVTQEIESGKNLSQSFQNAGIFPPLVLRMIKVGETTGQLDQALLNVCYFYDRDVKDSIIRMQAMIEPAMTIILGLLLGWVMLSVLSPIYDIISKM